MMVVIIGVLSVQESKWRRKATESTPCPSHTHTYTGVLHFLLSHACALHASKSDVQEAPLSKVSLYPVSVACSQPWFENINWKIPEMNNLQVLNCSLF